MRIDIATLFPDMCMTVLNESILGRAAKAGKIEFHCHQIRDYTLDKHRRVDDNPYGGGMGMVMQADPVYRCYEAVCEMIGCRPHVIYMSPKGKVFTQERAVELSQKPYIFILCGHYEGVDQRVIDMCIDEEVSLGDFVLTGGEIPAMAMTDSICRYVDGVISAESLSEESFTGGTLEYPQYTRPQNFMGVCVPEVLVSGNHKQVDKWREEQAAKLTRELRPDLIEKGEV